MNKGLLNKLIFYVLLLAFIISVSTHYLEKVLDLIVGVGWSHPLVNFLYLNIQGFIILFFISLYSDLTTKKELIGIFNDQFKMIKEGTINNLASVITAEDMIEKGLKQKFQHDRQLYESMVDLISLNKIFYTDCFIDIILSPAIANDSQHFCFNMTYGYRSNNNTFILAITTDSMLSETLITRNLADDVICVMPRDLDNNNVLQNINLHEFETTRGGRCIKEYKFKILTEKEKRKHLINHYGDFSTCRFYKVTYDTSETHENKLRFSYKCDLSYNDGYCYWNSPRLMFVKRLSVDFSALAVVDTANFKIQTFLSCAQDINQIDPISKKYILEPNDWINRGQGVAIIFPTKIN